MSQLIASSKVKSSGAGAYVREIESKLLEIDSVLDYMTPEHRTANYLAPGSVDVTYAFVAAMATGRSLIVPDGTYEISETIYQVTDGQRVCGGSKYNTIIRNTTTAAPLWSIGKAPDAVGKRGQYCTLENVRLVGNAATTEGVSILGIVDDGVTGAARDVSLKDVYIASVGAGFGLRVSAWEVNTSGVTISQCQKGLKVGSECNAATLVNTYITNCTAEAVFCPSAAGQPSVIEFLGLTAQYCGGASGTIDIRDGYAVSIRGLYLEGNSAPANVYINDASGSGAAKGVSISSVIHNLVSGTATKVIEAVDVKGLMVDGLTNIGGAMESLVKISGTLPTSFIRGVFVAAGSVSVNEVDDQSVRKATIWSDPIEGRMGVTDFYALTSQASARMLDSATGNVLMTLQNGRLYMGVAGTDPVFLAGTGSPEAAIVAPVGSVYLRKDGGVGTSLYVKQSGTGSTGWAAK